MANSESWKKIFSDLKIGSHNFKNSPFYITAEDIKLACHNFKKTGEKEVRILCKQDSRKDRPDVFIENDLFLLPTKNGEYAIIKGEGFIDIPHISTPPTTYRSRLNFPLLSSQIGDSEMQHLDFAYASSMIRTFTNDESLVLTIRGRKYTPEFSFRVNTQTINVSGVQTEVDAGYEGPDQIVLIEAKNSKTKNVIIRQLYYPFRQWQISTGKKVTTLFFEKNKKDGIYSIWQFEFSDPEDYNSIKLVRSSRFSI